MTSTASESGAPAGRPLDLTVIIVSYNTRALLSECLASVFSETTEVSRAAGARADIDAPPGPKRGKDIAFHVAVVDNASRDGSAAMVRREFPDVELVENAENTGFARANNQILTRLRSRHAVILNSDTKILPGSRALEAMVAWMDAHPDVGALGPKIVFEDGTIQLHCARSLPSLWTSFCQLTTLARRFPGNRLTGKYLLSFWDHESPREVECLLGACMMVRREVVEQVGALDEDFFLGGEDADWCVRIERAGWKVFYEPAFTILHYGGRSKDQMEEHEGKELHIAYYKYFRKHHGAAYAGAFRLMTALLSLGLVGVYALQMPFRPRIRDGLRTLVGAYSNIFRWCLTGR
jgi:GT2 family glycosyltransferase